MSRHGVPDWVGERMPASAVPLPPVIEPVKQRRRRPKHRAPVLECEEHKPIQHRDARPPWCPKCGLDVNGKAQTARGRLTLIVRACDQALADPELDDGTRRLIEDIRDQATGGD